MLRVVCVCVCVIHCGGVYIIVEALQGGRYKKMILIWPLVAGEEYTEIILYNECVHIHENHIVNYNQP